MLQEYSDEPRQLIIRVDGWDEISAVNVDSVGTYFRVARYAASKTSSVGTFFQSEKLYTMSIAKIITERSHARSYRLGE